MFLGIFETFATLLMLFCSGTTQNSYETAHRVRSYTSQPVRPLEVLGYEQCYQESGTSVTFRYDDTNYEHIFNETENSYDYEVYNIYSAVGVNANSIGSFSYRIVYANDIDSWRLHFWYTFNDIYNLKINVNVHTSDHDVDNNLYLYLKNDYHSNMYDFYSDWHYSDPVDSFENILLDLDITFTLVPVNQEEWYGSYDEGYSDGYDNGYASGEASGYANGYTDASESGSTASVIFSGILSIALVPVNFFLGILNFEVFGINIGAFVSALLTVAIVIIIVRIIFNGGNGKSGGTDK